MPRVTRSQAAALQNADGREPLEEVNENVKLPEPTRRTTRARSKAGTRKENYSAEEHSALGVDGPETSSYCAGTSVSRRTRVTRSQAAKNPDVIVLDEIETIEVTTTRRTRSTRRTRQTAVGDIEREPEEVIAVAPPSLITRGRRASRDSLTPSKLAPSKIPSPIRSPVRGIKVDETPSKLVPADLFAKAPSPAPISRSITRLTKKVVGDEDPLAGKPAVRPLAAKIAAAEQPDELPLPLPLAISTPFADRCALALAPTDFVLPTPLHFAALTPNSKFAPTTPGTTKAKKPVVLGSPFTSSPTRKVVTKPSLGSFASPTKAQMARSSTAFPSKSAPQDVGLGSRPGTSAQDAVKQKGAPSILLKKVPVIATTKAALLRTQMATGKTIEPTVRVVSQNTGETKVPELQRPKDAVRSAVSSKPTAPGRSNTTIQKTEFRKPIAPPQTGLGTITPTKNAPAKPLIRAQGKSIIEIGAKTVPQQQPVISRGPMTHPKPQPSSLLRKPSIPSLQKVQAAGLSKKPSIPTLPKNTTMLSKKASVPELPKAITTPSKKPSVTTFPKVQTPVLSRKPSIPAVPTTAAIPKKPSMSTLPKITTDLSRKPSIPTLARNTTTLSKKPSVSALPKSTAAVPTLAPATGHPKNNEAKPNQPEPAKTTKLVTQKKPFQPVKSTKPLTVPIPFQYDPGNRAARPTVQSKAPVSQPALPKISTTTGIKDRLKKFEPPKPKPVVKDARTMLREMRKDARLGTLPKLTGEVVYAELPQFDDIKATPSVPAQEPQVETAVLEPAAPEPVATTATISPPLASSTHEVVVISGVTNAPEQKTVPLEEFEKLKLAKDRAEAHARGTNAVLNWAAQEMVKRNAEAARRR
ncbi:hypothetical protein AOL_s00188g84 [Orbilia oligospora ATCC 24927]|uniref:Uncharacterized protein n=1 Tax=Arthrobotrys oligospora (strain ATCC 24927 / CBS 115.81 / DSM 1491) TaxID=756982 RepID=G1XQ73_ARTOA|nr:hypothetical protein AOL_s00188g84 [Orbilia oligospora ATCC 24927]EGX44746.1 hypothetical protein AOL_s00188g84 [Orbilia oligospora ATCC 24927]